MEVINAATNQLEQNNQVDDFIKHHCDIICVNLVDRTDPSIIIDKVKSACVPTIFFNRELVEEDLQRWNKLYYVGVVTLEHGIMQGKLVVEGYKKDLIKEKNNDGVLQHVILEGEARHQDAIIRTEYAINTIIDNHIQVEKVAYAVANWNCEQA